MCRSARYLVAKRLVFLLLLLVGAGCSWGGDGEEPDETKPSPLPDISQEVQLSVLWRHKIGDGADDRAVRLVPAVVRERVYAASADGNIKAISVDSGHPVWSVDVRDFYSSEELASGFSKDLDAITGGVGAGGDLIAVGTGSGDLVALNQSDGSLAWKVPASSEILSPPQMDDDLVVAQTIDGKVVGYDAYDGSRRWVYAASIPSLTLRGTSTPIIYDSVVIAAFANGRVVLLSRDTGLAGFDQAVSVAQGVSDLERLVDVDGVYAVDANRLFIASFQGRLVGIDLASGQVLWSKDASSLTGIGTGFGNVYLAAADGQMVAFDAASGREVWRVDALLYRSLTAPVSIGSYIAYTDFEGYLHLQAQSDGRFLGRHRVDKRGVRADLVSAKGRLYAIGNSGGLIALEIR